MRELTPVVMSLSGYPGRNRLKSDLAGPGGGSYGYGRGQSEGHGGGGPGYPRALESQRDTKGAGLLEAGKPKDRGSRLAPPLGVLAPAQNFQV